MEEIIAKYSAYLAPVLAFAITYFSIPAIIRLSLVKKLYDQPDERKKHNARISPLGGMAIFGGMIISFVFCTAHLSNPALNSVLVGLFVLFITGVKDDLYPLVPYKKMLGQLLAVAVVVIQGDVRLVSFYGLFGVNELPYFISVALSIVFFLGIINSFNFIDGINGLSAGIGVVISVTYAVVFDYLHNDLFLILALCIVGSQLAFLRFNLVNAKIFMGDSGSMILGFLVALLSISFLQINELSEQFLLKKIDALVFAFAVMIIPVVDTIRVVFIRLFILRRSPFAADRNHIHHALLDIGLSHVQASLSLMAINVSFVVLAYFLNDYLRATYLFISLSLLALLLSQLPFIIKRQQKRLGIYKPSA
ncbi:glycosyltransferase family 4 protein [Croceimicrobium sp.]|uniref:glycosyltransferase family 4 protein n=1 Tax=Croceimicrobium sp. TaxID=2828340 RepID=UPI003BA90E2F